MEGLPRLALAIYLCLSLERHLESRPLGKSRGKIGGRRLRTAFCQTHLPEYLLPPIGYGKRRVKLLHNGVLWRKNLRSLIDSLSVVLPSLRIVAISMTIFSQRTSSSADALGIVTLILISCPCPSAYSGSSRWAAVRLRRVLCGLSLLVVGISFARPLPRSGAGCWA